VTRRRRRRRRRRARNIRSHTETLNQVSRERVKLALNSPSFEPAKLPAAETRSEENSRKRKRHVQDEPAGASDDKVLRKNLVILEMEDSQKMSFHFNM